LRVTEALVNKFLLKSFIPFILFTSRTIQRVYLSSVIVLLVRRPDKTQVATHAGHDASLQFAVLSTHRDVTCHWG